MQGSTSLRARAMWSHLAVAGVGLLGLVAALLLSQFLAAAANTELDRRAPALRSASEARAGLRASLAHVRGYLALTEPELRAAREEAWSVEIRPALDQLARLVDPARQPELDATRALAEELNEWQWHIVEAASSSANEPARQLFRDEARAAFDSLLVDVTACIELEKPRVGAGTGARLAQLADLRGALSAGHSKLATFAAVGGAGPESEYRRFRAVAARAEARLVSLGGLTPEQGRHLDSLRRALVRHDRLADEVLRLRRSNGGSAASGLLAAEAQPRAAELDRRLTALLTELRSESAAAQQSLGRITRWSNTLLLVLGLLAALAAWLLARSAASEIADRIQPLADAMGAMQRGEPAAALTVVGADEVADMTRSFNAMRDALAASQEALTQQLTASEAVSARQAAEAELRALGRRAESLEGFAPAGLAWLAKRGDIAAAVLWVHAGEGQRYVRAATWSYSDARAAELRPGDGLAGEALRQGHPLVLSPPPAGYLTLDSGLGGGAPGWVEVRPVRHGDQVVAVLEAAWVGPPSADQARLVDAVEPVLASVLAELRSQDARRVLLETTRQQADLLAGQQEELRQTNAELEHRSEHLQRSEAELVATAEELRQTNEELEEQSSELAQRSRMLEERNRALQKSSRELAERTAQIDEASQYKSEFLANMSHELRTPLNSVLILAGLLHEDRDGRLSDKQREFARTIKQAGTDLLALINEILDLAKVEAGHMELHVAPVPVSELLGSIGDLFGASATESGIELRLVHDEAPEVLQTDRGRVLQVLRNLVGNAVKFTSEGSVTVSCRRDPGEGLGGPAVAIDVEDTGIGIPAERLDAVFEAFQQVDGSTSRRFGGTGLGLSIAREMAALLGGDLSVKSTVGVGSTFRLRLPIGQPEAAAATEEPASTDPSTPAGAALAEPSAASGPRPDRLILIVEDDPTFGSVLVELARGLGLRAALAATAADAWTKLEALRPDALILDEGLPDRRGSELLADLRADPRFVDLPVHVVSGADEVPDLLRKQTLGVLKKPATQTELNGVFAHLKDEIARRPGRLLVVEDDDILRAQLGELLGSDTVTVEAASSVEEARDRLAAATFDCVILDLGLPGSPGIELLRELRSSEGAQPAVVIYTGRDLSRAELRELEQLGDSVVLKSGRAPERLLEETRLFLHRVGLDTGAGPSVSVPDLDTLGGATVLVVDDDIRNVYALSAVLEGVGIVVRVAENGAEAIEEVQADAPDAVLMDMMMPVMDGYDAIRALRADARFAELPIIALTAKAMKADRARCLEAGASEYLSKPVDVDRLLSLLGVWLGSRAP